MKNKQKPKQNKKKQQKHTLNKIYLYTMRWANFYRKE